MIWSQCEWVATRNMCRRLRYLKDADGRYVFTPALALDGPEGYLMGLPVRVDDSAVGLQLRIPEATDRGVV